MAEDFREKMIINARKNVPLQHVPYFDVQNTDVRRNYSAIGHGGVSSLK